MNMKDILNLNEFPRINRGISDKIKKLIEMLLFEKTRLRSDSDRMK
jgi:hypothetical protein